MKTRRQRSIREQCDHCRHFTGIGNEGERFKRIENRKLGDIDGKREGRGFCAAGVFYNDVKKTGARMIALPCFPPEPDNMPADGVWPQCPKQSFKTPDELDAESKEIEEAAGRSIKRLTVVIPAIQKAADGKRGVGGTMPCPVCKTGTLGWSVAGYNGHIHARCSTADCVSFMQ